MKTKQHFLSIFEQMACEDSLKDIRKEAIDTFSQLEFPTKRHEEWKYTNINPIIEKNYTLERPSAISQETVDSYLLGEEPGNVLVFTNGIFNEELSKIENDEEIIVCNLRGALEKHSDKVTKFVQDNHKENPV